MRSLTMISGLTLMTFPSSAGIITLDADTPETGSEIMNTPLVTEFGTITFQGEIIEGNDPEMIAEGSSGNVFNIVFSPLGASLSFDFDVESISFLYGGNYGGFYAEAINADGEIVGLRFQESTGEGEQAGPWTLSGYRIRELRWNDTQTGLTGAMIDNIEITVPSPSGVLPVMAGVGIAFRRKRISAST